MTTRTKRSPAGKRTRKPKATRRTVDELITELAADVIVPHYDDVTDRHSALYQALCDAVTEDLGDHTGTDDFCERCQPAYLRVDEERNAELVCKERMAWQIGLAVGRQLPQPEPAESGGVA